MKIRFSGEVKLEEIPSDVIDFPLWLMNSVTDALMDRNLDNSFFTSLLFEWGEVNSIKLKS